MRYSAKSVTWVSTWSTPCGSADKPACIPREKQAPSVLRVPHLPSFDVSPSKSQQSESRIKDMIGCWKAPKSDVVPGTKDKLEFYWLFRNISFFQSFLCLAHNNRQFRFPSAKAFVNPLLSFGITTLPDKQAPCRQLCRCSRRSY